MKYRIPYDHLLSSSCQLLFLNALETLLKPPLFNLLSLQLPLPLFQPYKPPSWKPVKAPLLKPSQKPLKSSKHSLAVCRSSPDLYSLKISTFESPLKLYLLLLPETPIVIPLKILLNIFLHFSHFHHPSSHLISPV